MPVIESHESPDWVALAKIQGAAIDELKAQLATAEARVKDLEAQRDASTPHRNRDYTTNPLSDERLAHMCDETRWWKSDNDEIYRVVHELHDVRPRLATAEALNKELGELLRKAPGLYNMGFRCGEAEVHGQEKTQERVGGAADVLIEEIRAVLAKLPTPPETKESAR